MNLFTTEGWSARLYSIKFGPNTDLLNWNKKIEKKLRFFAKKTKTPEAAAAADAKVSSIGSQIEGQKGFLQRLPDFHDLWPSLPRIGKITDRSGSDFYRGPEMALRKGRR